MARGRRRYKPAMPFNVAMRLLVPTTTVVKGVRKQTFSEPDDSHLFYGSFRTFGGTESNVNDVFSVVDTATIDTWFDPQITADCMIYLCETGKTYKIIASPESIDMRNQFMQIRCERVGGAT